MTEDSPLSPQQADELGRQNHAALQSLRSDWSDWYRITITFPDDWQAVYLTDENVVLTASNAEHLADKMAGNLDSRGWPRASDA
jgi:hypothetical protein